MRSIQSRMVTSALGIMSQGNGWYYINPGGSVIRTLKSCEIPREVEEGLERLAFSSSTHDDTTAKVNDLIIKNRSSSREKLVWQAAKGKEQRLGDFFSRVLVFGLSFPTGQDPAIIKEVPIKC